MYNRDNDLAAQRHPYMKKDKFFKRFLSSKIFFILGIVIFGFLLFALLNKFFESREIDQEIRESEEEIARLETKNSELKELLSYLDTDAFLEQEARLKFNMQKPGESVMVVPEGSGDEKRKNDLAVLTAEEKFRSNPAKWWDYFFSQQ